MPKAKCKFRMILNKSNFAVFARVTDDMLNDNKRLQTAICLIYVPIKQK